jgi:hypothetical protein
VPVFINERRITLLIAEPLSGLRERRVVLLGTEEGEMMVAGKEVHSVVYAEMKVYWWSWAISVVLAERSVWLFDVIHDRDYRGLLRNCRAWNLGRV